MFVSKGVGQRKRKDEVEKLLDDIKSYRNNEEVLNMIRCKNLNI